MLPTTAYTGAEINGLKGFASEGGRIVFLGEHEGFYTSTGIATENTFLKDMGAKMENTGGLVDCGFNTTTNINTSHQVMSGMTEVRFACASVIEKGAERF